jgi:hypothetical protein
MGNMALLSEKKPLPIRSVQYVAKDAESNRLGMATKISNFSIRLVQNIIPA